MKTIVFLKETRQTGSEKEFKVRMGGFDTWLNEADFKHAVKSGHVFYKINKPMFEQELLKF